MSEYRGATITKGQIEVPGPHHIVHNGFIVKAEKYSAFCESIEIAKRFIDMKEGKRHE